MMSIADAAHALGVPRLGGDARFGSVSTDSRTLQKGALFVALRGENFDGHAFLSAVAGLGAAGAMVDERGAEAARASGLPCLVVPDTRRGLGALAAHWRGRFRIPLIAVAGSNGKTTVKEMVAAILNAHWGTAEVGDEDELNEKKDKRDKPVRRERVLATQGNLNNDIGLPLTLLRLRASHAVAVVELGMNHPGETAELAAIARPTVGLVNNAQREHQEFMKSVADVAAEHGALFAALPANGTAVINADDEYAAFWRGIAAGRNVRDFGIDKPALVSGRYVLGEFNSEISLATPNGRIGFTLHAAGVHNVRNAVAAAAAATAAGASVDSVARGLSAFVPVKGRLQKKAGFNGAVVIDDTYNANPDSVLAAIDVLARCPGRRVLVLGDMGEVGEKGADFHAEIGRYARGAGIDAVLALGEKTIVTCAAFGSAGRHFEGIDELLKAVRAEAGEVPAFLVKGSRFMRMERVVAALVEEPKAKRTMPDAA